MSVSYQPIPLIHTHSWQPGPDHTHHPSGYGAASVQFVAQITLPSSFPECIEDTEDKV